jgi:molecular chaperone GrpE
VQRPTPDEDMVREQLRSKADEVEGSSGAEEAPEPAAGASPGGESERDARAEAGDEPAQDPLGAAQAERDRYLELAQRTQADFENYRKRAAKEAASAGERAKIGLLRDFLPVLDNLERALESADEDGALADGVRLVHSELVNVLARNGVQPIEAEGQQFDPTVHEAMSTAPGEESGAVLRVVEKGYRLNDTVIRPARVVVSA